MPRKPVRFKVETDAHGVVVRALTDREVGILEATYQPGYAPPIVQIDNVHVDKNWRRHRIGTKLYEAAARAACRRFQAPLASGDPRSVEAEAFWQKQKAKRRAVETPDGFQLRCPPPRSLGKSGR